MGQEMFMKGIFAANNEHCLSRSKNMLIQTTVNIWKSYIWTADKEVNKKAIFAVMNTSWTVNKALFSLLFS